MARVRDSHRSKVYKWERAEIFPRCGMSDMLSMDDVLLLARDVARYYDIDTPRVVHSNRRLGGAYYPLWHKVSLSNWAYMRGVVIHELAHAVSHKLFSKNGNWIAGHGVEFQACYVEMLEAFGGIDRYTMVASLWRHGLVPQRRPRERLNAMKVAACAP